MKYLVDKMNNSKLVEKQQFYILISLLINLFSFCFFYCYIFKSCSRWNECSVLWWWRIMRPSSPSTKEKIDNGASKSRKPVDVTRLGTQSHMAERQFWFPGAQLFQWNVQSQGQLIFTTTWQGHISCCSHTKNCQPSFILPVNQLKVDLATLPSYEFK